MKYKNYHSIELIFKVCYAKFSQITYLKIFIMAIYHRYISYIIGISIE